jgi:hypothetical protein
MFCYPQIPLAGGEKWETESAYVFWYCPSFYPVLPIFPKTIFLRFQERQVGRNQHHSSSPLYSNCGKRASLQKLSLYGTLQSLLYSSGRFTFRLLDHSGFRIWVLD